MARPATSYPVRNGRQAKQAVQMVQVVPQSRGRHGSYPTRGASAEMMAVPPARRGKRGGRRAPVEMIAPPPVKRAASPVRLFFSGVLVTVLVGLAAVLILGFMIDRQAARDETAPADAIVVLGAAQWNGVPSPVLQARLDHAFDLWSAKYAPAIIVTGGIGDGDKYSESEVARQYLVTRGVPGTAILMEQQGRTSYESMVNADTLMKARGWERALLVSDPFHMLRLKRMADDLGLQGFTSPTRTSPIVSGSETDWYYKLREVATLAYYLIARQ